MTAALTPADLAALPDFFRHPGPAVDWLQERGAMLADVCRWFEAAEAPAAPALAVLLLFDRLTGGAEGGARVRAAKAEDPEVVWQSAKEDARPFGDLSVERPPAPVLQAEWLSTLWVECRHSSPAAPWENLFGPHDASFSQFPGQRLGWFQPRPPPDLPPVVAARLRCRDFAGELLVGGTRRSPELLYGFPMFVRFDEVVTPATADRDYRRRVLRHYRGAL